MDRGGGRERGAGVCTGDGKDAGGPLVFVGHGHGGSMRNVARSFSLQTHWPEAVVIYRQGLNTSGRLTDPEGRKPGWQPRAGTEGDRDLKLFDHVLGALRREYRIADRRIYATGHSNGGGFTCFPGRPRRQS